MASVSKRERSNADESSQDTPQAKRQKSAREHRASNFPPSFWDNLSKVSLTPLALRELHRRNKLKSPSTTAAPAAVFSRDLGRFARRGGPDLGLLRGVSPISLFQVLADDAKFPAPNKSLAFMDSSSSSTPSPSRRTQSGIVRNGKSSAYGKDFERHLGDHGVYLNNRISKPAKAQEIQSRLARKRASLSPSRLSEHAFESFQRKNEDIVFESDAMATLIPLICGNADIPNKHNALFTELRHITNEKAVKPKPDFFDGARLQDLSQDLRNDQNLQSTVIPTKHPGVPVAPNFFLEAKGPDGNASVAQRQACFDGTHGARTMHALQNFGQPRPAYDGNAYAYSSTYNAGTGTLQLYAHHATVPSIADGRPEYHMTQLKAYALTNDRETFIQGASAFRNARDLAKRHRNDFIEAANARAAHAATMIQEEATQGAISPQCIPDGSDPVLQNEAAVIYTEHASQNRSQRSAILECDGPSRSVSSSPTSFETEQMGSKRPIFTYHVSQAQEVSSIQESKAAQQKSILFSVSSARPTARERNNFIITALEKMQLTPSHQWPRVLLAIIFLHLNQTTCIVLLGSPCFYSSAVDKYVAFSCVVFAARCVDLKRIAWLTDASRILNVAK